MKSSSICLCGFKLHGCIKKEEGGEKAIFGASGSVCKLCIDCLSVKLLVEHNGER